MDYPHIVRTPGTCRGLPRIEGTRISVNLVVRAVVQAGMKPDEVLRAHPHLTLAQIHSALAFYFDNKEEVDAALREGDVVEEELRAKFPSRLPEKVRELRDEFTPAN